MHPAAALHHHFGLTAFRSGQEAAVRAALAGRDALVVMPTGAGKSLCYQLPALMRPDLTLVVSPLVSLMADQVAALGRVAPGRAALVSGQQDADVNAAAVRAAVDGRVRLLYVAPERFAAPGFRRSLAGAAVGLFVVDEAHCVSTWGHDFRPSYLRLGAVARSLGARAVMACTATATPAVAGDVCAQLALRDPVRVTTGYDRPALSFAVGRVHGEAARTRAVAAVLARPGATPAIVYTTSRRGCEALAGALTAALGRPVAAYHAGLPRRARAAAQGAFAAGASDVVVATSAFGMGIDKADVRTVVHAGVPPSLEAYYQEAGRAGRDGAPARALLLVTPADRERRRRLADGGADAPGPGPDRAAQLDAMWGFVDGRGCRRGAVLAHFGEAGRGAPSGACCDVCDPALRPHPGLSRPAVVPAPTLAVVDGAVLAAVGAARPGLGREELADVLRGEPRRGLRRRDARDGLPGFAAYAHLSREAILARVEQLVVPGALAEGADGRLQLPRAAERAA